MNGIQQLYNFAPSVFPPKESQELSRSYAQNKAQKDHPQIIPGYWWLFWTQHLLHYGARLFEEEEDEQFWVSTVSGWPP